ncbi:hypothetical protein [Streptomyces sp. NPDC058632]|uniref:hypothetical protein n=1 Tax=unclassified Streptomyces TaxID=2593676 RepID=UPI00365AD734
MTNAVEVPGRTTSEWLGLVNDLGSTADITSWIEQGGPGLADPPGVLDPCGFTPSRRVRGQVG